MGVMRDDFLHAAEKTVTKDLRAGTWIVWPESYTIRNGKEGRYVVAKKPALKPLPKEYASNDEGWLGMAVSPEDLLEILAERREQKRDAWEEYRPLVDYPNLFLKFARLADGGLDDELDTERNAAAALKWANGYGVLGLTPAKKAGAWWGDPRGGHKDTVAAFAFEAWTANKTLRLYEAAKREGGVDVETIASLTPLRQRGIITASPGTARDWALNQVAANVQYRVARYAYPQLYQRKTRTFVEGYDFANLAGALWLQALWLLTAHDVRYCEYPKCNRIIFYEQPEKPLDHKKGERKKHKTHKNKRFCNNTCVQKNRRMNERLKRTSSL